MASPSQTTTSSNSFKSSTAFMLVTMEQGIGNTKIPPTTPYLVEGITGNVELSRLQTMIVDSTNERDSIYKAKAEVDAMNATVKTSSLKEGIKESLRLQSEELKKLIDKAIEVDGGLNTLQSDSAALEAQRHKEKAEHYKAIEHATNPAETAAALSKTGKTGQAKIKEYSEKTVQYKKRLTQICKEIAMKYTLLRDAVPGSVKMRPFQDLSSPATSQERTLAGLNK